METLSNAVNVIGPNGEYFDVEACFTNLKSECARYVTDAYLTASYFYVCSIFIALFLNVFVISLYVRGFHEFNKKVRLL